MFMCFLCSERKRGPKIFSRSDITFFILKSVYDSQTLNRARGTPQKGEGEKSCRSQRAKHTGRIQPTESTKQSSKGLTETETATAEPVQVWLGLLNI